MVKEAEYLRGSHLRAVKEEDMIIINYVWVSYYLFTARCLVMQHCKAHYNVT